MNTKLLRSLQIFVEVADASNMSLAAKSLHMTVSAISQQLRKLEQDIGLSLFNRNTRHLSLTEAGQIYYRTSKELIGIAEHAQSEIEQLQETPSGHLRITAPDGFGGGLLSQPLDTLLSQFPKIRVSLELVNDDVDVIASGADLAICLHEVKDANLRSRHLAKWGLVLCAAPSHPLVKDKITNVEALHQHNFISFRNISENVLTKEGEANFELQPPRIVVNSMQSMTRLTRDGLGFAVLPEPEAREFLETGSLVELFCDWSLPEYDVYAVAPRHESVPVKTLTAVKCLEDAFSLL